MLMDRCPQLLDRVTDPENNEYMSVLDHEDTLDYIASEKFFDCFQHETKQVEPDYKKVQPCMAGLRADRSDQENFRENDAVCS